jgi:hypothetical protein
MTVKCHNHKVTVYKLPHKSETIGWKVLHSFYMSMTLLLKGTSCRQSWSWGVLWRQTEHVVGHTIRCHHFSLRFLAYRTPGIGFKLKENPITWLSVFEHGTAPTRYTGTLLNLTSHMGYNVHSDFFFFFFFCVTANSTALAANSVYRESGSTPFSFVFICWKYFPLCSQTVAVSANIRIQESKNGIHNSQFIMRTSVNEHVTLKSDSHILGFCIV